MYILFIERAIYWLNEGGRFGYIVSNQFMVTEYGAEIRSFIIGNTKINQLLNFGDSGVFADATNYPAILILQKTSDKKLHKENIFRTAKVYGPTEGILEDMQEHMNDSEYSNDVINIFDFPQSGLTEDVWNIAPSKERSVFNKIEGTASGKLKDFVERIFQGIKTGNDRVFYLMFSNEVKRDQPPNKILSKVTKQNSSDSFFIEQELLRPLLKGDEVRRYRVDWRGLHVLYPHKTGKEKGRSEAPAIPEDKLKNDYPHAYNYLKKHKSDLEKRTYLMDSIQKGRKDVWYELWNPRLPERFEQMKIITPSMSNKNNFSFNKEGNFYTTGPIYGIILKTPFNKEKRHNRKSQ